MVRSTRANQADQILSGPNQVDEIWTRTKSDRTDLDPNQIRSDGLEKSPFLEGFCPFLASPDALEVIVVNELLTEEDEEDEVIK